jgi:hypothetical protein
MEGTVNGEIEGRALVVDLKNVCVISHEGRTLSWN